MSITDRERAIGLVDGVRIGAVEEGSSFEYLLGLRDSVDAWRAELDAVISARVRETGPVELPGCALFLEESVVHDQAPGSQHDAAEEVPGQPSGGGQDLEGQRGSADTREVPEVEWPGGMVPSPNGVGWVKREGTPGPVCLAAERVCRMAASHSSLVEIGRAYQAMMRGRAVGGA
ncbi:MAG TPA: hypothetical protein VMS77_09370 [Conexivisphaerales archaeon]|nr:hypothetical protein [Conexivisphaerales archaeon]